MFSSYHLMIADFYNIPIVNVLQLYPRLRLELKKIDCVLKVNQSQLLKPYIEFSIKKEAEKFVVKMEECCIN